MNARQRLQHILAHPAYHRTVIEPEGSTRYNGVEDCKALRSLDALLADFVKACTLMKMEGKLMERARQLGYGPEDK